MARIDGWLAIVRANKPTVLEINYVQHSAAAATPPQFILFGGKRNPEPTLMNCFCLFNDFRTEIDSCELVLVVPAGGHERVGAVCERHDVERQILKKHLFPSRCDPPAIG